MATRDAISAKVDDETKEAIEAYQERQGYDARSDAIVELLHVGLRESSNPVVFRLKDQLIDWVSLLGIAAVIVFVAGATTHVIAMPDAGKLSIALVGAAVVLLGVFEITRLALGMNQIGSAVRDILGGESA